MIYHHETKDLASCLYLYITQKSPILPYITIYILAFIFSDVFDIFHMFRNKIHFAIRLSLHVCFLNILHKIFTLYIWFFFNLCPTPAKFDIHTWHLPLSSDIGGPTASPSTSHCLFPITNSIFCLTSVVRPFKLCYYIKDFTN